MYVRTLRREFRPTNIKPCFRNDGLPGVAHLLVRFKTSALAALLAFKIYLKINLILSSFNSLFFIFFTSKLQSLHVEIVL